MSGGAHVIGAGLAGLTAARDLLRAGLEVTVWEKSRGAGGRTSTRRGPEGMRFDHGAPFLHDGADPLQAVAALAPHVGTLPGGARWRGTVGAGANSAPAKALAEGVDLRVGVRIDALAPRAGGGWTLLDEAGEVLAEADRVLVTAPAPQAAELLAPVAPALAEAAASVAFDPSWAVMVAWAQPLGLDFDVVHGDGDLGWAVSEGAKPGRANGERWVLQATAQRSEALLEESPGAVAELLLDELARVAGRPLPPAEHLAGHRWRYARPRSPLRVWHLLDDTGTLGAGGDWCGGVDAGAAVRSGRAAAAALAS